MLGIFFKVSQNIYFGLKVVHKEWIQKCGRNSLIFLSLKALQQEVWIKKLICGYLFRKIIKSSNCLNFKVFKIYLSKRLNADI